MERYNEKFQHTFLEIKNATTVTKTDEKIELISEVVQFIATKLTVAAVALPPLILTVFNYFLYDLKDESYVLPFPVMYVQKGFLVKSKSEDSFIIVIEI